MPLMAAGFKDVKVVARFPADGTDEPSYIDTSTPYEEAIKEAPSPQVTFVLVVKESPVALGSMVISPKKGPLPGSFPEMSQRPASLGACMEACHSAHSVVCSGELLAMYSSASSAGVGPFGGPAPGNNDVPFPAQKEKCGIFSCASAKLQ